tara:strand:- start:3019 stop:3210 length:192 start_codon:yes stop_codon:yes gene_type:complete
MAYLVSPCCGEDYEELAFRTEDHMYKCTTCDETFDVPEESYEYEQKRLDEKAEDQMEEERLGL